MPAINTIALDELFEHLESVRTRHAEAQQIALTTLRNHQAVYQDKIRTLMERRSAVQQVIDSAHAAGLEPSSKAPEEVFRLDLEIAQLQSAYDAVTAPPVDPLPLLAANLEDLKFFFSKQDRKAGRIIDCDDLQRGLAVLLHPLLSLVTAMQSGSNNATCSDFPGYRDAVRLSSDCVFSLHAGNKWCVRGRVPDALSWVQFEPSSLASSVSRGLHDLEASDAYALFDPSSCRLIMSSTTCAYAASHAYKWVHERQRHEHVPVMAELSVAGFVHDFGKMASAAEALNDDSGGLALDAPPPTDPILRCVYDFAKDRLIPDSQVPFREVDGQLSLSESRARVLPHLFELRDAPWSSNQDGHIALLKHALGTSSPIYAWNESIEGLFGFRIRSSDHTWIRGEVYVAPDGVPALRGTAGHVEPMPTSLRHSSQPNVCRVGAAWIRVWQTD